MAIQNVLCEVGTETLFIIQINFNIFRRVYKIPKSDY